MEQVKQLYDIKEISDDDVCNDVASLSSRIKSRFATVQPKWVQKSVDNELKWTIEPVDLTIMSWKPANIKLDAKKGLVEYTIEPFNARFEYSRTDKYYNILPPLKHSEEQNNLRFKFDSTNGSFELGTSKVVSIECTNPIADCWRQLDTLASQTGLDKILSGHEQPGNMPKKEKKDYIASILKEGIFKKPAIDYEKTPVLVEGYFKVSM